MPKFVVSPLRRGSEAGFADTLCFAVDKDGHARDCTAGELRRFEREMTAPTLEPGETPRIVATLALRFANTPRAYFVEYKSRGAGMCGFVYDARAPIEPVGGVVACTEEPHCDAVCLSSSDTSGEGAEHTLVAGTVPTEADSLRLMFRGGRTAVYPLDGPVLPSDRTRRVFMVELDGFRDYRRAQALRNGQVIAEQVMPTLDEAAGWTTYGPTSKP